MSVLFRVIYEAFGKEDYCPSTSERGQNCPETVLGWKSVICEYCCYVAGIDGFVVQI